MPGINFHSERGIRIPSTPDKIGTNTLSYYLTPFLAVTVPPEVEFVNLLAVGSVLKEPFIILSGAPSVEIYSPF